MKIAKFQKRILAYVIDQIFPTICGVGLPIALGILFPNIFRAWYFLALIGLGAQFLLYVLITTISLKITNGFTLGNKIAGIKTVREDGAKIKLKNAFVKGLTLGFWVYPIINALFMLKVHTERTAPDSMTNTINVEITE